MAQASLNMQCNEEEKGSILPFEMFSIAHCVIQTITHVSHTVIEIDELSLVCFQVWEGHNVVRSSRMLVGDTDPAEAAPGTIRGDFSVHISRYLYTLVHCIFFLKFCSIMIFSPILFKEKIHKYKKNN